eukprot:CAMPEP_0206145850 /NCGR_PEP_ID=MMETSP1473-20131121/28672_1 /ASSEMBLY_ACC=CAM_ASM_001109 /TAXON_ID=1461547 /ORGANISM="Stichococcus sp, Strain RCC1054" /LENGTH=118 /DNA_ID=CAMNT_0053542213 /DNA_START=45 /DNA_END=398 /DNA_ORIENTATION=+
MEMTEEERNVMRFQKQRMKDALGDKYALKEEDGGGLTHLGRSLADFEDDMPGDESDDDDGDAALNEEMTGRLNFGGGFERASGKAGATEEPTTHKSKKEVMEEIMAKSKRGKAERQMQ